MRIRMRDSQKCYANLLLAEQHECDTFSVLVSPLPPFSKELAVGSILDVTEALMQQPESCIDEGTLWSLI